MNISLNNNVDPNSINDAKKDKIYYYPINSLTKNPLNAIYEADDTPEELLELKESILLNGLQQPITVSRSGDSLLVMSGHRRCKAMWELFKEGRTVYFNGKELNVNSVPLIIQAEYKTEEEQFNALVASNKYRTIKPSTTSKIIEKAKVYYDERTAAGVVEKGRTRDKIGKLAGVSGRTVDRYLKKIDNPEADAIIKKVNSMTSYIKKVNPCNFPNMERTNIRDALTKLGIAVSESENKQVGSYGK